MYNKLYKLCNGFYSYYKFFLLQHVSVIAQGLLKEEVVFVNGCMNEQFIVRYSLGWGFECEKAD